MRIIDSGTVKSVLHPGMEIKNYKEICSLLDEKQKTGEAKQIQLGNWQLYFSYRKQGHKFIIEEIFDIPKEKVDGRAQGNHSLFTKDIADNILRAICSGVAEKTNAGTKWIKIVGLANDNYGARKDIPELRSCDTLKPTLNDFYYYSAGAAVKSYLQSALNYLEKNNLASVSREYIGISRFNKEEIEELEMKYDEESDAALPLTGQEIIELWKEKGYSAIKELEEKYFMSFEEYLFSQPFNEDSTDLTIKQYSVEEYLELKRDVVDKYKLDLKTIKGREKLFTTILCQERLRTLYEAITVVPNRDNVPSSYRSITKKEYEEYQKTLNHRIYEHLSLTTEKRYEKNYEKWQQSIQEELSHMKLKIGTPKPHMTKAYRNGYLFAESVNLQNRMKVIDALIKI